MAADRPPPAERYRVTNWAEYDAALRQRGSLTVWFTDAAITAWRAEPRTTPGGQPHYSALAIATALSVRDALRRARSLPDRISLRAGAPRLSEAEIRRGTHLRIDRKAAEEQSVKLQPSLSGQCRLVSFHLTNIGER